MKFNRFAARCCVCIITIIIVLASAPAIGQQPKTDAEPLKAEVWTETDGVVNGPVSAAQTRATPQSAVSKIFRPQVARSVAQIEATTGEIETLSVSPSTGLVTFLSTRSSAPVPAAPASSSPTGKLSGSSAQARARGFMQQYGTAFGIDNQADLVLMEETAVDEAGMEHVRLLQTYHGVPVTGGEMTVHLKGDNLVAVLARTLNDLDKVDMTVAVDAADASLMVEELLVDQFGISDATLSTPRLEIFNPQMFQKPGSRSRLAWFIEARKIDLREYIWIDAVTGLRLLQFSQLTEAKDREVYDANDPGDGVRGTLPGVLLRVEGGAAVVGDPPAVDANAAYDYSGDTYDYFFNEHGRDSYDGAGAKMISTVRYCPIASEGSCPYLNAFWNGTQMVYGAGFPVADDVDAHELTHAVTEYTANLFYYMQSGALNESFSDIFGETVDLTNAGGTDTAAVRWKMGEDVPGFGAIRDMMDPTAVTPPDPGKMSDAQFVCGDPGGDSGGVHSNSGVPNHAYALMVDGGTYNSITVTGIGLTKAGKIQYRALAHYLVSTSDFLDNYHALKQSCQDLVGVAGITTADCTGMGDALDAVEMDDPWPCSPSQAAVPAFCPAGQAPSMFHYEDFESFAETACPSNGVPATWCTNKPTSLLGAHASSGVQSIWGYNRPTAGSMSIMTNLGGTLPANARMQFNHSFGFDNFGTSYYDGGVVEYSTNGGATWSDAGSLITSGQAYGGTIESGFDNPLAGQSAFAGDTWGYTASQLDLSSLASETFGYRFTVGTDNLIDEYGWFIDDIRIYSCAACQTTRVLDNAYNGTAALYQASDSVTAGSGFAVGLNESVTFEAGSAIILQSGFSVQSGSVFTATVTPGVCP